MKLPKREKKLPNAVSNRNIYPFDKVLTIIEEAGIEHDYEQRYPDERRYLFYTRDNNSHPVYVYYKKGNVYIKEGFVYGDTLKETIEVFKLKQLSNVKTI